MARRVIAMSGQQSPYANLDLFEKHSLFSSYSEQVNDMLGDLIGSAEVESWAEVESLQDDIKAAVETQKELLDLILNATQKPKG